MQLPAADASLAASIDSGGSDGGGGGGLHATSSSGGKAPSSPGSPSKSSGGGGGTTTQSEKPVKVLPCPRCESMNTKFCYYNNYSVTQPRHFCRQCQRYWTAGGTLRNVPVGGGSRKKNRHPRGNEPYLQQQQRGPPVVSPPGGGTPFGGQSLNVGGHFQQMLSQEMGGFPTQLNFSQLPGFGYHHHPYAMDPVDLPPSMQHAMYGTAPPIPPFYQLGGGQQQQESSPSPSPAGPPPSSFPNDATVKSEYWSHPNMVAASKDGPRFESSMLLNLGLNSRQQQPQGVSTKNGSPPHGSSTIEEEGSTPTNRYSNSGYEEADAVSSMWHSLHDMDNIFQ